LDEVRGIVRALNPKARVHETSQSEVALTEVLDTGLFEMAEAEESKGWLDSLAGHTPETLEYGISNFVYRARRNAAKQKGQVVEKSAVQMNFWVN
jgi:G3E family GTPase